jgi:Na+/H+ antiporter NhaA
MRDVIGGSTLAGIGFTVSLFITGLAFDSQELQDDAKIGTLIASVVAAGGGAVILGLAGRAARRTNDNSDTEESEESETSADWRTAVT